MLWLISDLLNCVITRKASYDYKLRKYSDLRAHQDIIVTGADISARDNVSLSVAANNVINVLTTLRDRALIDDVELLRLIYRFTGESTDVEEILKRARSAPPPIDYAAESSPPSSSPPHSGGGAGGEGKQDIKIDPETGEPKDEETKP
jgi:hypothetical protein